MKLNWVDGPNRKTMKKLFPILDLVDDDDVIIVTDDDVLFNNKDIIGTWRADFLRNGGSCAIVGNNYKAGGFDDKMYMVCGDLICSKRMLDHREPFMIDEILGTYHDDRFYISLFWLNGIRTIPASRFLIGKSPKTEIDYGFNKGDGMTANN